VAPVGTKVALDAIGRGTRYALHLQRPGDTVADDGDAARRLFTIRAADHPNQAPRRE
jgi:hypothetical protein